MKGISFAELIAKNDEERNIARTPGGLERQEREGQITFVQNNTLPIKFHTGTREDLKKLGVVFHENIDDLFVRVALPDGWKKQAKDHKMWSTLLNSKDVVIASIFYKASFHDKRAYINVEGV